jgi:tol-pal system protein YbgF
MKKTWLLAIGYWLVAMNFCSCSIPMFATRDDLLQFHQIQSVDFTEIKKDISSIQEKQEEMFKRQAALFQELKELNLSLSTLKEKVEANRERLALISQRIDDLDAGFNQQWKSLAKRLELAPPGSIEPKPSELYQLAYNDYIRGKYDLAILGFDNYLKQYSETELGASAQYFLGECYLAKKEWEKAVFEYSKVSTRYPQSDKVLMAELKKTIALKELNRDEETKKTLEWIVSTAPNSLEAVLAREKLKQWFSQ